jgi:hypothetical protein
MIASYTTATTVLSLVFMLAGLGSIQPVSAQQQANIANADPAPTPAPTGQYEYLSEMPYSWMATQGYSSVGCGYGYNRDEQSGRCVRADWVSFLEFFFASSFIRLCFAWPRTGNRG